MSSTHLYDVVIIGNGILGLQTAYFLKKQDPRLNVALIGPSHREGSASVAASAMINVFGEIDHGLLDDSALWEKFKLTYRGGQRWDQHAIDISEFSDTPLQVKRGTYLLLNAKSTSIEVRNLNYVKKVMTQLGHRYEEVNPDSLSWFKPGDDACPIEMIKVDDGFIQSEKVLKALDKAIKILGVTVFPTEATQIIDKKRIFGTNHKKVALASGELLEAPHIVFANGAYAQKLIDQVPELRSHTPHLLFGIGSALDLSFPEWVHKYGGLSKELFEMDAVVRTLDRGGNCGLHVVPFGKGEFYVGASSGVLLDPEPYPRLHGIKSLVLSAISEINCGFFHAGTRVRNNGFRPTTLDCFPLLGESHLSGYWFANGTKRDGLTASPEICSKLAQAIITGHSELPEIFKPSRKLISYKTKTEAMKSAKLMLEGSDRQHGGIQAAYMVPSYRQTRYKWVTDLYEKRNLGDFGMHPEVLHLYDSDEFYQIVRRNVETKRISFNLNHSELTGVT